VNPSSTTSRPEISDVTIVIPVFNQLAYTKGCVESLRAAGIADEQIIIINNASADGTVEFLAANPRIQAIHNPQNLGCGGAWTQGAKLSKSPWTVVLNNDVLIPQGCMEGLVDFATKERFDIVSPAMCEGEMDYDLAAHAGGLMQQMRNVYRRGIAYGVCFMIHRRVFDAIGYFDSDPKLGGYEDDEYFRRARKAGFRLAVTGRGFLHHFGSITQKSIKAESGGKIKSLGDREYYRRKTGQTWLKRKMTQVKNTARNAWWLRFELWRFGQSLHEFRLGGKRYYK
jgi:N-acetylglucosaminyl-diphospho-decaprenol L-rhamnosyltransferase